MTVFEKGLITILACDALLAVIAIPLILRKVPPNVVYGYRTRATLSDEAVWYDANAHFGRGPFIASVAGAIGILIVYRSGLAPGSFLKASVVILVAPPLVAAFATARFVRALIASRDARKQP